MLNQDVEELTLALAQIRLEREEIVQALDATNRRENELIQNLNAARAAAAEATNAEDRNPHVIGDLLSITNDLRNEFGITGRVTRSGRTFVTIRNSTTRRTYTRAWFNLSPVETTTPPRRR